jgi:transcriptional regulator GlxA family with amidase domain
LALIHEAPEQKWTVEDLAGRAAISRAAFARRFASLVGEPPLTYVTRWRMNLAAKLLRTTATSAEQIAAAVGYESPTAFGNAFRRHLSVSPGRYRRDQARAPRVGPRRSSPPKR